MAFVDEARIHVVAGKGGNGCVAFRREKFVPRGGPSGGDGGHGGSVILVGDAGLNTLYSLRNSKRVVAERGRHGEGSNRTGKTGSDREIEVPLGTIVRDAQTGELLGELIEPGQRLVVAQGGRGGRGNARFATSTRQAPDRAQEGRDGGERELALELKLLADVGLVGLPNAGKSTFISAVSAARPRIADYPFTTLAPNLGVVTVDAMAEPIVLADLPGLIAGAAEGAGLGIQFLRHVERCRVLLHLVDLSGESGDARADVDDIERELEAFDPGLLERHRILAGSKVEIANPERVESLRTLAAERGWELHEISSVTGAGVRPLLGRLQNLVENQQEEESQTGGAGASTSDRETGTADETDSGRPSTRETEPCG